MIKIVRCHLGTRPWHLYLREVSRYRTNEQAPTMLNQACFRHIEATIPTECAVVNRVRIFGSLKQILEKSPGTRVFITGRSHIQAEIEKCLCGKVKSVSLCPKKEDIIRYLHIRLGEDETPDC